MEKVTAKNTEHEAWPGLLSRISRRRKLALFLRHVPAGARVLEVGPGDGWFTRQLVRQGRTVVSLDLRPPADIVGDINAWESLGLKPHGFDAVVALEVVEHVDCLASLTRLCKPGGLILLSSPHPRWDWVMRLLERLGLNQKRTSPHDRLIDFAAIPLRRLVLKRPLLIHQVGLFINTPAVTGRAP
jgi:2-polyprenyl-3-methyl-5-hydroxy-6-metoxy-1,4-benzoquinol methylase